MEFLHFLSFLFLLLLGFIAGRVAERRHWRSIHQREEALKDLIVIADRNLPDKRRLAGGEMVTGSVVIGQDYYLGIAAAIKNLFGGSIRSYEGLFERARREAILRMKEDARAKGNKAIYNIKFTTMNIASRAGAEKNIVGVEVVAYGTAVTY